MMTAAGVARSQGRPTVRGDIAYGDGATIARGVLVEVLDTTAAVAARALSDEHGRFLAVVPRPGRYTARALRIGFRPTVVPTFDVGLEGATLHVVLGSEPVNLTAARITSEDACRIQADSGKLVAAVWEETRKALAVTDVTASDQVAATVLNWRSTRRASGEGALWQRFEVAELDGGRPYVGADPTTLAEKGYGLTDAGGGLVYYGPDARALISDAFASGHCFRLVPPAADRTGWIGVAFRPVRGRRGVVDITGTFWVDRATGELRLLEYRYTGAPVEFDRVNAGGRVEFERIPTGAWIVSRWMIRLATMLGDTTVSERVVRIGSAVMQRSRSNTELFASLSGGEVLGVTDGRGALLDTAARSWSGRFERAGAAGVPAGASVEFAETGYFAAADSAGEAIVRRVLPGRYTALVSTEAMRALDIAPVRQTVMIPETATRVVDSLRVPDDRQLLVQRCGRDAEARARAVVFGTIVNDRGEPLAFDTVHVSWMAEAERRGAAATRWSADSVAVERGVAPRGESLAAGTDALGRWSVCGVPRDAMLLVLRALDDRPAEVRWIRVSRDGRIVDGNVPITPIRR